MRAIAAASVLLLASCGADDSDATPPPTDAPPTSEAVTTTDRPTTTTRPPTTTRPATTTTAPPDGAVVTVPVDVALLTLAPDLTGDRKVDEVAEFDRRFCDGSEAREVPDAQAVVTYEDGAEVTSVGLYRFVRGDPYTYLAEYGDAVRRCALGDPPRIEEVDLGPEGAFIFDLETESTVGVVVLAVTGDVLWVVYRRSTVAFELSEADLDRLDEALFDA